MKLNISAEMTGNEVAEHLSNEVKSSGVVLNDATFNVKCYVLSEKSGKDIEVDLNKVKFVMTRD